MKKKRRTAVKTNYTSKPIEYFIGNERYEYPKYNPKKIPNLYKAFYYWEIDYLINDIAFRHEPNLVRVYLMIHLIRKNKETGCINFTEDTLVHLFNNTLTKPQINRALNRLVKYGYLEKSKRNYGVLFHLIKYRQLSFFRKKNLKNHLTISVDILNKYRINIIKELKYVHMLMSTFDYRFLTREYLKRRFSVSDNDIKYFSNEYFFDLGRASLRVNVNSYAGKQLSKAGVTGDEFHNIIVPIKTKSCFHPAITKQKIEEFKIKMSDKKNKNDKGDKQEDKDIPDDKKIEVVCSPVNHMVKCINNGKYLPELSDRDVRRILQTAYDAIIDRPQRFIRRCNQFSKTSFKKSSFKKCNPGVFYSGDTLFNH